MKSHDSSPSKGLDKASPLPAMLSPTVKVSIKSYETLVQRKKEGEQRALQSLGGRFAWMFSNHGVHEGLGVGNTPSLSSLSITSCKYGQLTCANFLGEVLQMCSFPALQGIATFKSTGLSPSLLPTLPLSFLPLFCRASFTPSVLATLPDAGIKYLTKSNLKKEGLFGLIS